MNFKKLKKSFMHAGKGIKFVFNNEQNFRMQVAASVVVLFLAASIPVQKNEAIILGFLVVLVLILELFNTAVEYLLDVVNPRLSEQVQIIKDIMAAMVLSAAAFAVIIGCTIFIPYFL